MAIEITDEQLLAAYREAALALATAQSYTINGKTVTKANLPAIWDMVVKLENRIAAKNNPNDAFGFVQVTN